MNTKLFFLITLILLIPSPIFAQVVISEIMYDLEGSDSGREWIEIYNDGNAQIDLSTHKLFEAQTNHGLKLIQGTGLLEAGEIAIVADNSAKFLVDWSNYTGHLFDSSFSLKNTGENLILRNVDLVDIDLVNYLPDWGAVGDGNSLQKINNQWSASNPSPGVFNTSQQSEIPQTQTTTQTQSPNPQNTNISWPIESQIFAKAGQDRVVVVGADTEFKGEALGLQKEPLDNARYLWNFGDGTVQEGKNIFHNYYYPNEYIITLDVSSGKFSASDRINIKAIPADIIISSHGLGVDSFVELHNKTPHELDLSFWVLKVGLEKFIIPKNTIVSANKKLIFSPQATNFNIKKNETPFLHYPNGSLVTFYEKEIITIPIPQVVKVPKTKKVVTEKTPPVSINISSNKETQTQIKNEANVIEAYSGLNQNQTEDSSIFKWLLSLLGIMLISTGGVLFIRHRQSPQTPLLVGGEKVDIDEIEIEELK